MHPWETQVNGGRGTRRMQRGVQVAILMGALGLVFQFDRGFRQWEMARFRHALAAMCQAWDDDTADHETTPLQEATGAIPPRGMQPVDLALREDRPGCPMTAVNAEFPGLGWYRVKLWRGWFPEEIHQCLETDFQFISDAEQWRSLAWGTWDRTAGASVAAEGRMYTTDGIRLDVPPAPSGVILVCD